MKIIKRDVAGHFCDAKNIQFFMHSDVVADGEADAFSKACFCISLIGEWSIGWDMLNASGKTYELCVFDKQSENPWTEIERFCIDDKQEAINKFNEMVEKYSNPILNTTAE